MVFGGGGGVSNDFIMLINFKIMIEKKKQMTIRHCKLLLEKKRKIKLVSNEMQFMVRRTKKKPNEKRIRQTENQVNESKK